MILMSMINCPECGEKISNKAESCPYCGCPSCEFKNSFFKPNNQSMNYCPKCGSITYGTFDCVYCGHELINTGTTRNEYYQMKENENIDNWKLSIIKKVRQNPEFSEKALWKRINHSNEKPYQEKARFILMEENAEFYTSTPKCPTCSSTDVEKIGTGERVVSVALFGLFSRKVTKTYRCNSCGYMW